MANFRTTADYVDKILDLCGEITNGNSAFEADALYYLNRIHHSLLTGGTDISPDVDELWPWAMAKNPIILELQPKFETGTIQVTEGSPSLTFSVAPTNSLEGWHIKVQNDDNIYQIATHSAGATSANLDANYPLDSASGLTYEAFKLDYELVPDTIVINATNNKIDFTETTAGTEITATLTQGTYSPSGLATEIKTQLDAEGASTYTVSYASSTRKFSITSDLGGGDGLFSLLGASGTNVYVSSLPTFGLAITDHTGAATYTSERPLGAIAKLSQPMFLQNGNKANTEVSGIDIGQFYSKYPPTNVGEGNPTHFTVVEERDDGYMKVRFNKYPNEEKRIEVYYVSQPLDLYDNAYSAPLVPRKWSQILTHGAAAYLSMQKNDDRVQQYLPMARNQLAAMQKSYRKTENRVGVNYAQVVARPDLMTQKRRRLLYGYEDD